jgi:hypothetical protein
MRMTLLKVLSCPRCFDEFSCTPREIGVDEEIVTGVMSYLAAIYEPYLKRIEASSMMYLATVANAGAYYKMAIGHLYGAVKKDVGVLTSLRFGRTLQIALAGMISARAKIGSTSRNPSREAR